ncbi:efflux RND transporter periplasmic adaptor subunit [Aliifodinibius sp. S!AR15-10]|uniref:efflux RND transporter periplasmic adaptor subunit n=1 Tax=Aliifodinibius sp. S!AR15-10 TaxID=2950437 RepID=UPI002866F387|nr:efflux RND transporter periplasmic adaptor subunit [Aliifodinibius sp. S!AR15-10]MDR8391804.1 efflux RND transporter periplasmic adaptor subunit [Aliifodinibius sp. S!AR15-10]
MKNLKSLLLLLSVCSLALFNNCTSETQSKNTGDKDSTAAIPVEISGVTRGSISAYYSTTTTLEAEEEAMVVAKVRGIVESLQVEEGDYVQKGQVLAKLEDEQLKIEAQRAKATMDRLYNDYQRNQELYEKQLISAEQFENAKFEYASQQAAYELAQLNLEYSTIKAPISGVISQRMIKVGNMVNTDEEVFKITDFNPLLAILHVPEHEMSKLNKNQVAYLQVDAIQGQSFQGKVLRISPVVNPETGTFKVTVAVNDNTKQLKPGMFGRIRIVYDTHDNALMIPKNAVISEDGYNSVYEIKDKLAYRKNIETGYINGNNIEVISGLNEGDQVVTIGQSSLQDSALVEVVSY